MYVKQHSKLSLVPMEVCHNFMIIHYGVYKSTFVVECKGPK